MMLQLDSWTKKQHKTVSHWLLLLHFSDCFFILLMNCYLKICVTLLSFFRQNTRAVPVDTGPSADGSSSSTRARALGPNSPWCPFVVIKQLPRHSWWTTNTFAPSLSKRDTSVRLGWNRIWKTWKVQIQCKICIHLKYIERSEQCKKLLGREDILSLLLVTVTPANHGHLWTPVCRRGQTDISYKCVTLPCDTAWAEVGFMCHRGRMC